MSIKQAYIETYGCQMNERDSEIMAQLLASQNYAATSDINSADLIIVNTCSVREKAEQKAYSLLGRLKFMKKQKPSLIIAVSGCVAQQDGKNMLRRMPFIDIVLGPQNIYRLPDLLNTAAKITLPRGLRQAQIATNLAPVFEIPPFLPILAKTAIKRFVTIMQGCNNFCTYCVVPYTRGRENSRHSQDILAEIRHLAANGVKEITLLGQNVNSYGMNNPQDAIQTFPDLLRAVNTISGLERIRFTTSHPKDLSDDLISCFAELDKLCAHIHLPVQSGSNRILKSMNRKYSIETYLDKVASLRRVQPEITLTTDIIVGFPGETEQDFAATMQLLETVRFESSYSFKYSDRPKAPSVHLPDKVDILVKEARLNQLQAKQNEITLEHHQALIGKSLPVMVEGQGRNSESNCRWSGRTSGNITVNFHSSTSMLPGQTVLVSIQEVCRTSLRGEMVH